MTRFVGKHLPLTGRLGDDVGTGHALRTSTGIRLTGSSMVAQLTKPGETNFGSSVASGE